MLRFLVRLLASTFLGCWFLLSSIAGAEPTFLEPEQAFQFSARQVAPDQIQVSFHIADGYYLYRERFKVAVSGATMGEAQFPPGKVHFDEIFKKNVETYRQSITFIVPLTLIDATKSVISLNVQSQGCSDQGLCYSPIDSSKEFSSADFVIGEVGTVTAGGTESGKLAKTLESGRFLVILPLFFLLGLGLAFTPCVLPMVPILSSIIVGEGANVSRHRGLVLSLSYALGMAIVYTSLGVAAGLLGEGLAAWLQNPWVLGGFGLLLVGLSLSMFNVYHLQVPAVLQSRLSEVSGNQSSGRLVGVFVMGAISALIVGPCVAAPLASALLYISQTHNVLIGGTALFSMAMGMSVPLILVGLSAGSLLPRAGKWMETVKHMFGVMMLGMALWLVSPVIPVWLQMLGWSALLLGYGIYLLRHKSLHGKIASFTLVLLGGLELFGLSTGGREILAPLAHLTGKPAPAHSIFVRIHSTEELDAALLQAKTQGKMVLLDFYADWCVSCKEMEQFTLTDAAVKTKLESMVLLQADVTANNPADRELLKRFHLFGPPGMIFFGVDSAEAGRVIGFQKTEQFLESLESLESMKQTERLK